MADRPARDPISDLAQRIQALERQVTDLSTRPLLVPILDNLPSVDYPGNIWMYPDGRIVARMKDATVRQVATVSATAAAGANPAPPTQATTRTTEWTAQWGQAYRQSGGFTGGDNSRLVQGSSGDSYNGKQASLIGFDYASIQSALAGSTVSSIRIWLYSLHTWYFAGGTVWTGMHNNTAKPGTFSGGIGRDFVTSFHVPNTGANWYSLSTEFGSRFRDGSCKGIILEAPNNDRTFYVQCAGGPGTPTSNLPRLSITYVK